MPMYNGLIASIIKGSSTGGEFAVLTGVSQVQPVATLPAKLINNAIIGVFTQGVSGTYAVDVVSAVGGCTFVIAGSTGLDTDGSKLFGTTVGVGGGIKLAPRVTYVAFSSAEAGSGFTSSVFICGEY